jgi:hypothetical protein
MLASRFRRIFLEPMANALFELEMVASRGAF